MTNDNDVIRALIDQLTHRLNDQSVTIAELRTQVDFANKRLDEADHMTSEAYGAKVVEAIMVQMPTIQAAALKQAKRGGRR